MGQLLSLFSRTPDLGNENRAAIDRIMSARVDPAAPGDNTPYRGGIATILTYDKSIPDDVFFDMARAYAVEWVNKPDYPLRDVEIAIAAADGAWTDGKRHATIHIVGYRK